MQFYCPTVFIFSSIYYYLYSQITKYCMTLSRVLVQELPREQCVCLMVT